MTAPSPLTRFRLLMGLRLTLTLRGLARRGGAVPLLMLSLFFMISWAFMLGDQTFDLLSRQPEQAPSLVHAAFHSIFLVQVALGVLSLSASEFFDPSRLMHHPVEPKEVFLAMSVGMLLSPMTLLYGAPVMGATLALDGGPGLVLARIGVWLALTMLGAVTALALNLTLLGLMTRRRLRDVASVLGVVLGLGLWAVFRTIFSPGREVASTLGALRPERFSYLPSAWLAEIFLGRSAPAELAWRAVAFSVVFALATWLGGRALRAAFLGQIASPRGKTVRERRSGRGWLPADIAEVAAISRTLLWRHPHLKATWLRETLFLLMPVLFLEFTPGAPAAPVVLLLPPLLAFSHAVFFQSLLGLDGTGLPLLLMSPRPRWRLLLGRCLGLGGQLLIIDLVLGAMLALGSAALQRMEWPGPSRLALVGVAIVVFDVVTLSVGILLSVYVPYRLVYGGRRPVQGGQGLGCTGALIRLALTLPSLLIALALSALATMPLWPRAFDSDPLPALTPGLRLVAMTVGIVAVIAVFVAGLLLGGIGLDRREEAILRTLTSEG